MAASTLVQVPTRRESPRLKGHILRHGGKPRVLICWQDVLRIPKDLLRAGKLSLCCECTHGENCSCGYQIETAILGRNSSKSEGCSKFPFVISCLISSARDSHADGHEQKPVSISQPARLRLLEWVNNHVFDKAGQRSLDVFLWVRVAAHAFRDFDNVRIPCMT